ncbi:MAG TPA: hypothetical protein VEU33_37795 [Archangium sp.]|nr:hypothetical protein [Archangium sp.]
MIRVKRGKEPKQLVAIRQRELKRIRALLRRTPRADIPIGNTYRVAARSLWRSQKMKCCYCELIEQLDQNDVEHFRPKSRAVRGNAFPDKPGYFWLSWTWKNLLFACGPCNRQHKGTRFPLARGSKPLQPWRQPPGKEQPLLLDPATEDPLLHLRFEPYMERGKQYWRPNPRHGSQRGFETIQVLGLDRQGLIDLYRKHVDEEVRPKVGKLRQLMRSARSEPKRVRQAWRELTRELLARGRPFTALSYDALDYLVPSSERQSWGLRLPAP